MTGHTPVTLVATNGRPVTQVAASSGKGVPGTVCTTNGAPITLVATNGTPMVLYLENGTEYSADSTAPTLSNGTDTATGQTTADVGVDTNEANGTLYVVVTTSSTSPTAAQVKAGQDNSGAAAAYASSQSISSTGTKAFSATGLAAGTAYTAHFMHEDASGNKSTVVKGNGMTTTSAFSSVSVRFDGTNDYMTKSGGFTGASDGKVGLVSFWLNMKGGDGGQYHVILEQGSTGPGLNIYRWGDGGEKIHIVGKTAGSGIALIMDNNTAINSSSGWVHCLAAWNVASGIAQFYLTDVENRAASPTADDLVIDYSNATDVVIGARAGGSLLLNADIADLYINTAETLDISNSANRRKFISAGLKPVYLGANGELPTGNTPTIFQGNPVASWHTNLGSGGGFTLTGALAAGASSPSD